ncbi:MAG: four helix bundle protein [Ruminococcus sp.]|nr:four helix bundle protein [Ruminococcus sp.]MBQ9515922.1 four helix bundle protein [Ruminococcus sp.]
MSAKSFRDLIVWQKSIDLVVEVYQLIKRLPKEEIYSLSNQMRRSSVSIPSNIAEGQQRKTTKEFVNFLSIAKGSNAELQTQLIICVRLGYLTDEQIKPTMTLSEEISKMLTKICETLQTTNH